MPKEIKFLTVERDGDSCLVDARFLGEIAQRLNADSLTEAEIAEIYGERATPRVIVLKPNSYALKHEIARLCQVDDEKLGKKHDPTLTQAARVASTVESWNLDGVDGKPAAVSMAGFDSLPMHIAEYVDARVYAYLAPEITSDPDFLAAWQRKLPSIEAK